MNKPWLMFCMVVAIGIFLGGWETRGWKDGLATEKADVAAYQHKDEVQTKQAAINQSEVITYEKNSDAINAMYANGVPASPIDNMPVVPTAPSSSKPASCEIVSKKYKLTFRQCDDNREGYLDLWDAWTKQSTVKN
jgi:hypothetical protein